jgi:hypothetical protein
MGVCQAGHWFMLWRKPSRPFLYGMTYFSPVILNTKSGSLESLNKRKVNSESSRERKKKEEKSLKGKLKTKKSEFSRSERDSKT